MALNGNRLRRAFSLSSSLFTSHRHRLATTNSLSSLLQNLISSASQNPPTSSSSHRFFHFTQPSLSSLRSFNDVDKIDPDTILFEGCDYKHWLIVMDFGKDPQQRPPPEEMVETYVQTLAKVVGSVEEAKKKIYACSTTIYTGFQAEIDEDTSKKLEDMPGVIFVLPDSYVDPVNKEYGGDKYINGTIIPRPPLVQYGRMKRGRQNDQRPRGQMPNQGNHTYNQHGSMSGEGSGYIPQSGFAEGQTFPANSGPTGDGGRSNPMSNRTNYSEEGRDRYQSRGNTSVAPQQGNYNIGVPPHQGNYNHGVTPTQGSYNAGGASHQGNYNHGYTNGDQGGYIPRGQVNNRLGDHGYNHPQGQMRNVPGDHGGYTPPQGQMKYPGDGRDYAPPPPTRRADGQTGIGTFEQCGAGQYGRERSETYGQVAGMGYDPGYTSHEENQRFSQAPDQSNTMSAEHKNYPPSAQYGLNQRRV